MNMKEVILVYPWEIKELLKNGLEVSELQKYFAGVDLKTKTVMLVNHFDKKHTVLLEVLFYTAGALITYNPHDANMFIFGE